MQKEDQVLAAKETSETNWSLQNFANCATHDLNNILSGILMELERLRRNFVLAPDVLDSLSDLKLEALRGGNLTAQLRLFTKTFTPDLQELHLNSLLESLTAQFRRLASRNVEIAVKPNSQPVWVHGDREMLQQMMIGLCASAQNAMHDEGKIIISATAAPPHRSNSVRISLALEGKKLDKSVINAFRKVVTDDRRPENKGGWRLGCARMIAHWHQGTIEIEDSQEDSAMMTVSLPSVSLRNGRVALTPINMPAELTPPCR